MYLEGMRLDGPTTLVTGGGGGIGAAYMDALLEAGAHVVAADRDAVSLEAARRQRAGQNVSFEALFLACFGRYLRGRDDHGANFPVVEPGLSAGDL